MSLEMEAERQRAGPPPKKRAGLQLSPGWEVFFRLVALLVLAAAAFAVIWVPVFLLAPVGPVIVIAVLTIAVVALAGRLHELRVRVDRLEERVGPEPPVEEVDQAPSEAAAGEQEHRGAGSQE